MLFAILFAILGYALLALPFVALFIFAWKTGGLECVLFSFGLTAVIVVIVAAGVHFLALAGVIGAG